nr:tripartite motif-containing protein 7-like [Pogona vitticeps]
MSTLRKTLMGHPVLLSVGLEERVAVFSKKASVLEVAMKKYKGRLELALGKVNVTLDPDTANPCLILSLDIHEGRVECGVEEQNLPNVPQKFDPEPCVLGYNRFTSGNQWWEVEVQKEGLMWAIGIAKERVRRKGNFIPNTSEGIWAIGKASGDSHLCRSGLLLPLNQHF